MSAENRTLSQCDHPEKVTTENAGIARHVCERCSYVSISYDHDFVLASAIAEFGDGVDSDAEFKQVSHAS